MPSRTILLVDDDEMLLSYVKTVLQRLGYHILTATNGPQAMLIAENHEGPIDLLLSDVIMPGMKGRDVQVYLKSKKPNVRFMFMSGYNEDILQEYGIEPEGVDFIRKPFRAEQLEAKLAQMFDH